MSTTRIVQRYIREHPSVADCLSRGLINYSALAREICAEHQIDAFDAAVIACRRYRAKRKSHQQREKAVTDLLRKSKVRIRNKIVVVTIGKEESTLEKALSLQKYIRSNRGDFNLIEGEDVITIITNSEYLPEVKEGFRNRIKKTVKELVQISMLFNQTIETTPGVVAYIYRLFAEHDINIREEMSCWTNVMIIIDEKDMARAMQVLSI